MWKEAQAFLDMFPKKPAKKQLMKRINQLLHHPVFTDHLDRLAQLEKDRIYCCHGLSHLLDTARIACLLQYQKGNDPQEAEKTEELSTISTKNSPKESAFPVEIIYAAALLHDIGRVLQYEQGLPHETAGLAAAKQILTDCCFTAHEQALILDAIQFHRKDTKATASLSEKTGDHPTETDRFRQILHTADKLSRNCFTCPAADTCYWPEDKKNQGILW